MATTSSTSTTPSDHLARRLLAAFEREFWAGHHDRGRLLGAPLRELHRALDGAADAPAVIEALLLQLEAPPPGPL